MNLVIADRETQLCVRCVLLLLLFFEDTFVATQEENRLVFQATWLFLSARYGAVIVVAAVAAY